MTTQPLPITLHRHLGVRLQPLVSMRVGSCPELLRWDKHLIRVPLYLNPLAASLSTHPPPPGHPAPPPPPGLPGPQHADVVPSFPHPRNRGTGLGTTTT